ncbi:MAG: pilus assembly protein N-terminal domain-containing protein [Rhodospirillales bacterium]|nr:pilus assembly protein N-terminal domain-containing protein [Rhodospirillales bacterium]
MIFSRTVHFALLGVIISLYSLGLPTTARAQETVAADTPAALDILPAAKAQERGLSYDDQAHTHPPIKLTPDKSELVRLESPAASIIVGNPNHLSILADTSKTLVLVARAPGATQFTVLDQGGNIIMQRHVIVASPKEKYLRVRRSCAGSDDDNCRSTSVFYCPDMCHEIIMGAEQAKGGAAETAAAAEGGENTAQAADAVTSPPENVTDTD